ncbi:acetylserotonin O-methyltransferase [Parvicella tangerina]|uniref:Mitomycin biosynthesis 6-O-methyltransferase n=1 Tax=Parvicella tangerina TaxID=2829795 RepID=A0A916JNH8_9FLAO|nr:acetylserotonin O-methyltransferase [Parvicella tangerina]CAG5082835.1 Mitomycin biosynthesis 6-O-methyltransferase [Parvicella tangerina]
MDTKNQLKSFFTEHWKYIAVSTACEFGVFDALIESKTSKQFAEQLGINEEKTSLLLNALVSIGFLDKKEDYYTTNELSVFLTEKHPDSLRYACMNWSGIHLTAWQNLRYTIATGKSAFEDEYYFFNQPFFEYLNENPSERKFYQKAMNEYARDDYKTLPDLIDFSKCKSVIDVGGGYGALLKHLKKKYPNLNCTLFEQLNVLGDICLDYEFFNQTHGDFFEEIPKGSDTIILARILHDWNYNKALKILNNCYDALPDNGSLFIIENCTDKTNIDLSLLSLNMSVMCESFERSSTEYISLANEAGFQFEDDVKLNELQTVLRFIKK